MKRLTALLSAAVLLFLSGCSGISNIKSGLVEISGFDSGIPSFISADFNGDTLMLFAPESIDESEDYEADTEINFYLYLVNAKTARLTDKKLLTEFSAESVSGAEYTDDGNIMIYDEYNEKSFIYDSNLNFIEERDYTPDDINMLGSDNALVDDFFSKYDFAARYFSDYSQGALFNAFAFYDDNDNLYFTDEDFDDVIAGYDKTILTADYSDSRSTDFGIYDFGTNTCINTVSTPEYGENDIVTPTVGAINAQHAFVSVSVYSSDNETDSNKAYIWNYNSDAKNTSFDVDCLNNTDIDNKNSSIIDDLKNKYGINIFIDKYMDEFYIPTTVDEITQTEDGGLVMGAQPLRVYYILTQLQAFLTYFPDGFVSEMYTDYINSDNDHNGFDIYIVKEIKGDSAAFANGWDKNALITFATDEFNFDQLAHEFMHIIDFRIFDYYESIDSNFDEEWFSFVPDNFIYGDESNEYTEEDSQYFIDYYAMTSQYEDRAELFMRLFSDTDSDTSPDWYTGRMKDKTDFLCRAIKESYPSVQNADNIYWEKWIKES